VERPGQAPHASTLYTRLCGDGRWIGVNQNQATFPVLTSPKAATAFLGNVKFHNCGGPHFLRNCPETPDQAKIEANKNSMVAFKKLAKKDTISMPKDQISSRQRVIHREENSQTNQGKDSPADVSSTASHIIFI
jgi:hypothetical protein